MFSKYCLLFTLIVSVVQYYQQIWYLLVYIDAETALRKISIVQ